MTQVHDIRKKYFEEGKTISAISKETGFDRKTVRGYLNKEDFNSLPESAVNSEPLSESIPTISKGNLDETCPIALNTCTCALLAAAAVSSQHVAISVKFRLCAGPALSQGLLILLGFQQPVYSGG